ncbi:DedA family protein [Effusibacillus lacus]|uniref:Alkaline phosphatase n=1 Tax=Effusibacillus lacus TaxID=1348429 RepID=A0A292YKH1_9BACL|nr:DedA family protein [Effusibacillus lacus]TCS69792.1 SNARE associated Golgi protein [Effusibacillus lacus]GAX88874.1 alkaline phosphatase [Effusibacillus lacus]
MPDSFVLIQEYGYFFLFLIVLSGVLGFPVPDEGVLFFAGVLIAKGLMSFVPALVVSVGAVMLGSFVNYRVASLCGVWKMARWGRRIGFPVHRWKRSVRIMRRYGIWAVPVSYFIPGVRMGVSYGAGLLRLPAREYTISAFVGVVAWVGLYLWLGSLVA